MLSEGKRPSPPAAKGIVVKSHPEGLQDETEKIARKQS